MQLRLRLKLTLLALGLAGLFVLLGNAATDWVLGQRPFEDGTIGSIDAVDVAILELVFMGLPYFTLAACAERRPIMWAIAVAFTLLLSGFDTWQVWRDSLTGFADGANIGLGIIMTAAPLVVSAILAALSFEWRRTPE